MTRLLPALLLCPALLLAGIPEDELSVSEEPIATTASHQDSATPGRGAQQEQDLLRQLPAQQLRWLEFEQQRWLGLQLPAMQPQPLGAVLLVGDSGEHADSASLLAAARRQLSEAGWHTLAIALPDPPRQPAEDPAAALQLFGEWQQQALARISHSLASLRGEGADWHAVLGDGQGAWLLATAISANQLQADALVLHRLQPPTLMAAELPLPEQNRLPILDLVLDGSDSQASRARLLEARRRGLDDYQQLQQPPASLNPLTAEVTLKRLQGWLLRQQQAHAQRKPR